LGRSPIFVVVANSCEWNKSELPVETPGSLVPQSHHELKTANSAFSQLREGVFHQGGPHTEFLVFGIDRDGHQLGRTGSRAGDHVPGYAPPELGNHKEVSTVAQKLEKALTLGTRILGLTIDDRESMLLALHEPPTNGLAELRSVLLLEHEGRVRSGLV